jgi:hypothetical protein
MVTERWNCQKLQLQDESVRAPATAKYPRLTRFRDRSTYSGIIPIVTSHVSTS